MKDKPHLKIQATKLHRPHTVHSEAQGPTIHHTLKFLVFFLNLTNLIYAFRHMNLTKQTKPCTTMDCIRNVYDVLPVPPTVQKEARISGIRLLPSCVVDIWSQTLRSSNRSAEPQHCAPAHKHWHPNMSGLTCQ